MTTLLGFIPDGYTDHGFIAAVPRLYPELRFDFRPCTNRDRVYYWEAAQKMTGWKLREIEAALLKRQVLHWDMTNGDGTPLVLNETNLLIVKPMLFNRLVNIVLGNEASDEDPKQRESSLDSDTDGEAQDLMEQIRTGRPIADVRAERLAKNSFAASA